MARVGRVVKAPLITTGNPDTVNDVPATVTTLGGANDLSGQLGVVYRSQDGTREWIYVQFSATSTVAVPAANDILYWMSSTSTTLAAGSSVPSGGFWVVDNRTTAGNTGTNVNAVAGILRNACTRGNYVWAMRRGLSISVPWNSTSTLDIKGDVAVATGANAAVVQSTATVVTTNFSSSPQFWLGGAAHLGTVNNVTTSTVILNINLDVT